MHPQSVWLMITYGINMGNYANVTDIFNLCLMVRQLSCHMSPPPGRDSERDPTLTTAMSIYDDLGQ